MILQLYIAYTIKTVKIKLVGYIYICGCGIYKNKIKCIIKQLSSLK